MFQVGTNRGSTADLHYAPAGAGWIGIALPGDAGFEARLGGSYGSGRNGDVGEFDNLHPFGTNHRVYGIVDNVSLSNAASGMLRLAIAPRGTHLRAFLDAHVFALPEPGRAWRGQDGRLLAAGGGGTDPLLGGEIDLVARWRPDPSLLVDVAYGVFIPAGASERAGFTEPSQIFLLTLGVRLP